MDPGFVEWPVPILKPESSWSEFDRDFLEYMQTAYADGFRPRYERSSCIDAGELSGRHASLVFRGTRNGWEPWLSDGERCNRLGPHYNLPLGDCACVCVRPPFRGAAHLALEWLRGRDFESLLGDFEFVGGYPAGIVLRADLVSPSLIVHQGAR